jgi:hypothetical protein
VDNILGILLFLQNPLKVTSRKLFPSDKNYILREVQISSRKSLLRYLASYTKAYYLSHHNPLGIQDETVRRINASKGFPLQAFDGFYHDLSALYRFMHGEVQLEFLFDGSSHWQKYEEDWVTFFKKSVQIYCSNRFFIRAVLDIVVFHSHDRVASLAGDRLKYFLTQEYELKVYKYKGIRRLKVS